MSALTWDGVLRGQTSRSVRVPRASLTSGFPNTG
jgi:hypothetical protein